MHASSVHAPLVGVHNSSLQPGLSRHWHGSRQFAVEHTHGHRMLRLAAGADDIPAAAGNDAADGSASSSSNSSSSSSSNASRYDPSLAAGFRAPPGKPQLWWVDAFEARRRAEAEGTATAPGQQPQQSAARPPWRVVVLQLAQLAVAVGALLIWPASLAPDGLYTARVWLLAAAYYVFFAGGSVSRLLRHGALAPRSKDAQAATLGSRVSWILFVAALPLLHWTAVRRFITQRTTYMLTVYDIVGAVLVPAAICLNLWAASHLGAAYNRVVAPQQLVTSGPYAWVQHPIYTSYMLLFFGAMMSLHSAPCALLVVAVCLVYYKQRTSLERRVLASAFKEQYDAYAKSTRGLFLPGL